MSLFLNPAELEFIHANRSDGVVAKLYHSMLQRVIRRAASPGLMHRIDSVEWWHLVEESLCDAAMIHAIEPSPLLGAWIRNTTIGIVRRPLSDWIGPWFRDHSRKPPIASLETAHISCAVAAALDLAPDVFSEYERQEIAACLRERAIPMACEYLSIELQMHNHWVVVNAGLAVAAAVVNDRAAMDVAANAFVLYCDAFQPDGTYAESLQYANYACFNLMLAYEALTRREASYKTQLSPECYAGLAKWSAYAHLYSKPLTGWGLDAMPRSINFGDSAALFVPSAELLLHIAARTHQTRPTETKLARWMFDAVVDLAPKGGPQDRASFGFVNRPGFLSLPLLAEASAVDGVSPWELGLPVLQTFSCGDAIVRDAWNGRTTLAVRTGGDPMHIVSHVHGDMNSLVLIHNRERLLVDPGHSCYRNVIHEFECSTKTHNTCTFQPEGESQERGQGGIANRCRTGDLMQPPIPSLTKLLLSAVDGPIRVVASDAAGRYGEPIEQFIRISILCGSHVVFVVDQIKSAIPVRTRWNWLLNNRDGLGELKVHGSGGLEYRRGDAAIKMFSSGGTQIGGPQYAYVHDAYHPLPNQLGEGANGSGILMHWRDKTASLHRVVVHSIALDAPHLISNWEYRQDTNEFGVRRTDRSEEWSLNHDPSTGSLSIRNAAGNNSWSVDCNRDGKWHLRQK